MSSSQPIDEILRDAGAAHQAGRWEAAERGYRQVLAAFPNHSEAAQLLGVLLLARGRPSEAVGYLDLAVRLGYRHAGVLSNLGAAQRGLGEHAAALAAYDEALKLDPAFAEAHYNRGIALRELGRLSDAEAAYREALRLRPNYLLAHYNLGNVLAAQHNPLAAEACYRRALAIEPKHSDSHNNLATALMPLGRLDEAVELYTKAVTLRIAATEEANQQGVGLVAAGRIDEAQPHYANARRLAARAAQAHSNALMCRQYRAGVTLAELADAHREWNSQHAEVYRNTWRPHANKRQPDRPLRLGLLSGDFTDHPLSRLLVGTLEALDRRACHVTCYSNQATQDAMTQRLSACTDAWRPVAALSDDALAGVIRGDAIDVLIDLTGHTAENRLLAFARKPAPVQCSYLGYPSTLGMAAIDYLIADEHMVPAAAEPHFSERILRLPHGLGYCEIPPGTPEVEPLRSRGLGEVRLASFNNPAKITAVVIDAWAKILQRLTGAMLLLKFRWLDNAGVQAVLRAKFAERGVASERILFAGPSAPDAMMAAYHDVDLALDTFPYTGGTTTCLALWMGVPVVTWPGETMAGRQSLSVLAHVGLSELVARSVDDYVELAVQLASDRPRLASLRSSLRPRVSKSKLFDRRQIAADLLAALQLAWRRWCEKEPPISMTVPAGVVADQVNSPGGPASRVIPTSAQPAQAAPPQAAPAQAASNEQSLLDQAARFLQQQRLGECEALCQQVLDANLESAEAHRLMATAAFLRHDYDRAAAMLDRAIYLSPNVAEYHDNRASLHTARGDWPAAAAAARRSLELSPTPGAAFRLGRALQKQGQLEAAADAWRQAIQLRPGYADAWFELAAALTNLGQFAEAERSYRQGLTLTAPTVPVLVNLANVLQLVDRFDESIELYRRAIAMKPDQATAYCNLGNALRQMGRTSEAVVTYEQSLAIDPQFVEAHNNLGVTLQEMGNLHGAERHFQQALAARSEHRSTQSNLLFLSLYREDLSADAVAERHREWGDRTMAAAGVSRSSAARQRASDRPLRIGFLSADLGEHPVGRFLQPVLAGLDRRQFSVYCYSDRVQPDALSEQLRSNCAAWHDTHAWNDERLAGQIASDEVDLLFDLAGHTHGNRLHMLATKPAPVQLSWMGYPFSTGLAAIDYLVADRHLVPQDTDHYYRERVLRLPHAVASFLPPPGAPPVNAHQSDGAPRLASFNNPAKVNEQVVELWSQILRQLDGSTLTLKHRAWGDPAVQQRYRELFARHGIAAERLHMQGWSPLVEMLQQYAEVDLALDPFPYGGGSTSWMALWMGVPIITWPGTLMPSRQTYCLLAHAGLTETVAGSREEYLSLAVAWAQDRERLAARRREQRGMLAASPLCDVAGFVRGFSESLSAIGRE